MPVAVDSIRVLDLFFDCLWDAESEKGPYPTEMFASVLEDSRLLLRCVVSPEKVSSTLAATMKAVG